MENRPIPGMWWRYALFVLLSMGILIANVWLTAKWRAAHPQPPEPIAQAEKQQAGEKPQGAEKEKAGPQSKPGPKPKTGEAPKTPATAKEGEKPAKPSAEKPKPPQVAAAPPQHPSAYVTLGSADPKSPYRMLATFTSEGAAALRIELASGRYRELEDRSGYLGHITVDERVDGKGCPVQVVGPGTPAAEAGLRPGDVITAVDGQRVASADALGEVLKKTRPKQTIELTVMRSGKEESLAATLGSRPLELVRPESDFQPVEVLRPDNHDPLSFLLTLRQIDDDRLKEDETDKKADKKADTDLGKELGNLDLRSGQWETGGVDKAGKFLPGANDQDYVVFRRTLPQWGLEVRKIYRLEKVPEDKQNDPLYPAYDLRFNVEIRNIGNVTRKVAYQLDGPTGLPAEGWWYSSKVSRHMFTMVGLRDVVVSYSGPNVAPTAVVGCPAIGKGDTPKTVRLENEPPVTFAGVDAQYFSAVMIPDQDEDAAVRIAEWQALRVGKYDRETPNRTDTTVHLGSAVRELKPNEVWTDGYKIFAGPRDPNLLAKYGLKGVVYYGWFEISAVPLLLLLHFFHDHVVFNYGLAILMLTVLVRACMFPFSKQQALNAQKMAELQPEIKKIQEKYKTNMEARGKAQQELFKKHNYKPLGGCLVVFFQLPVFLGLYRALMVNVQLRQAPLFSESIRWASNLAAPDMMFNWSGLWHSLGMDFVNRGVGMFGLGPYFNFLPLVTILLFIWQQKKLMPPPTDEQQAVQQKVMQFMMIFMGIMFYKVASGLCLYFIASSLWSIAERKFLPKAAAKKTTEIEAEGPARPIAPRSSNSNGAAKRRKRSPRGR